MNLIINIFATIMVLVSWFLYFELREIRKKYPPQENLPRENGMIYHPTLGAYPEEVVYKQGMAIMPGQTAKMPVELPKGALEKLDSELRDRNNPNVTFLSSDDGKNWQETKVKKSDIVNLLNLLDIEKK